MKEIFSEMEDISYPSDKWGQKDIIPKITLNLKALVKSDSKITLGKVKTIFLSCRYWKLQLLIATIHLMHGKLENHYSLIADVLPSTTFRSINFYDQNLNSFEQIYCFK